MSEWAVCYVGHSELFGSFDQAVCFVDRLESRVFSLEGVDSGNYLLLAESLERDWQKTY